MNSNQNLRSKARMSIGKLSSLLMVIVVCLSVSGFQCGFGGGDSNTSKDGRGWRVWIRTEPCPGRFDWLSVAKEQPGGGSGAGLGTYWLYDNFLPRQGCTEPEPFGCTFAEATALMETLRPHPKLLDICCKEYSVWKNELTQKRTIVVGKFGKAPEPWMFEAGPMCCEEAEALSGLTGACSGSQAPPLGPHVRRTPGNTNTTTIENGGGGESCWDCVNDARYCRQECYMTGSYGVPPSFGDQCAPKGFGEQCYPCWEAKCKGTLYPKR